MRNIATPVAKTSKKVINGRGTMFATYNLNPSSRLDMKLRLKTNNEGILMKT